MAIRLKINAKGIDVAISKLSKNAQFELKKIDDIMAQNVADASLAAKANLPGQYSSLASSINNVKKAELSYQLRADKDYAAYVEFGTGDYAARYVSSLEPEWQDLAMTFFVNGEGKMPEEPYFYPAVKDMWSKMIKEIQKATNARYK